MTQRRYEDRACRQAIGRRAQETIRSQYSIQKFRESIERFLDAVS